MKFALVWLVLNNYDSPHSHVLIPCSIGPNRFPWISVQKYTGDQEDDVLDDNLDLICVLGSCSVTPV